jgi:putative peptidoglycan lipid II flippase
MRLQFFGITGQESTNQKIFRAALTVGFVTVVVKVGVIVKDLMVAHSFGRNDSLDAFLFALMVPAFAVNLVVGAVSAALVPVLVEIRQKEGIPAGQRLLSTITVLTTLALVVAALLLLLLSSWYLHQLGRGFSPEKLHVAREFLYVLLPWSVLNGLAIFMAGVLNAVEKFAVPALVPLLTPLAIIVFIAFSSQAGSGFSLVAGTVAGSLFEVAILVYLLRSHNILGALRWYGLDANVRAVLSQAGPMMAGCFLMGATPVVDQSMAAMLAPGSIAALSYGSKVTTGLLAIGATALSTAALPYFSKMAADRDWPGCRHTLKRYSMLVLSFSVPVTLLLIGFSKPIVKLLFQRGAFTRTDTEIVSAVQACYCIQIPFYVLCVLFVRFISSVRRNDLLMYVSALNLVVNIVMNLILMRVWGIAGIALSSSIVTVCSFVCLCTSSIRLLGRQSSRALTAVQAPAGR